MNATPGGLLDGTRLRLADLMAREKVSRTTVWRWCYRGINGVRLPFFKIGKRTYTTEEAVSWWATATVQAEMPSMEVQVTRQRAKQIKEAEGEVDAFLYPRGKQPANTFSSN